MRDVKVVEEERLTRSSEAASREGFGRLGFVVRSERREGNMVGWRVDKV
jgi:hypothetical protein